MSWFSDELVLSSSFRVHGKWLMVMVIKRREHPFAPELLRNFIFGQNHDKLHPASFRKVAVVKFHPLKFFNVNVLVKKCSAALRFWGAPRLNDR